SPATGAAAPPGRGVHGAAAVVPGAAAVAADPADQLPVRVPAAVVRAGDAGARWCTDAGGLDCRRPDRRRLRRAQRRVRDDGGTGDRFAGVTGCTDGAANPDLRLRALPMPAGRPERDAGGVERTGRETCVGNHGVLP